MTTILGLLIGVVIGVVVAVFAVVVVMRRQMVVAKQSRRSYEETCAAVERVVPAGEGWGFPMPKLDMLEKLGEKGVRPQGIKRIQLHFVCNPKLAGRVLSDSPQMAAIMPCSWAVYEREDGSVWLSKMNITMMSKIFAGEVKAAMSQVAAADDAFIAEVLG